MLRVMCCVLWKFLPFFPQLFLVIMTTTSVREAVAETHLLVTIPLVPLGLSEESLCIACSREVKPRSSVDFFSTYRNRLKAVFGLDFSLKTDSDEPYDGKEYSLCSGCLTQLEVAELLFWKLFNNNSVEVVPVDEVPVEEVEKDPLSIKDQTHAQAAPSQQTEEEDITRQEASASKYPEISPRNARKQSPGYSPKAKRVRFSLEDDATTSESVRSVMPNVEVDPLLFQCKLCPPAEQQSCDNYNSLKAHYLEKHFTYQPTLTLCELCHAPFTNLRAMRRHMNQQCSKRPGARSLHATTDCLNGVPTEQTRCPECNLVLPSPESVIKHMCRVHNMYIYPQNKINPVVARL